MKKVNWKTLPMSTPENKGLMSSSMAIGYMLNSVYVKLTSSDVGYLLNTNIPISLATSNVLLNIIDNNDQTVNQGLVGFYISAAGAILGFSKKNIDATVELLNNKGLYSFYIKPNNSAGYSAILEMFVVRRISNNNEIISSGIVYAGLSKPVEATIIATLP